MHVWSLLFCLVFVFLQPRRRSCCPKMASSYICTIQRPWSSIQTTKRCTRTWAIPSVTISSPPHTTPISWRISSKGPAAQKLMSGNGFQFELFEFCCSTCNELIRSLQSAESYPTFGLSYRSNERRPRAAGCLWFVPVKVQIRQQQSLGWFGVSRFNLACLWTNYVPYSVSSWYIETRGVMIDRYWW